MDKRKSKRHGPPLFLVQLLLTVGIVAGLAAAVIKWVISLHDIYMQHHW